jgi:hypothetical protein
MERILISWVWPVMKCVDSWCGCCRRTKTKPLAPRPSSLDILFPDDTSISHKLYDYTDIESLNYNMPQGGMFVLYYTSGTAKVLSSVRDTSLLQNVPVAIQPCPLLGLRYTWPDKSEPPTDVLSCIKPVLCEGNAITTNLIDRMTVYERRGRTGGVLEQLDMHTFQWVPFTSRT